VTWDVRDLGKTTRQGLEPEPVVALPAQMPRTERAERLLLLTEETMPAETRRDLLQAGLVDDVTWGVWRRLATRGVYEL